MTVAWDGSGAPLRCRRIRHAVALVVLVLGLLVWLVSDGILHVAEWIHPGMSGT